MKRRGRPLGSAGKRKDRKKATAAVDTPLYELGAIATTYAETFPLTTCNVCGGVEDEDLIILCDGPGCTSEIHMYCLTPVITAVPEGDWFCEACDAQGTTVQLRKYFERFAETSMQILSFAHDYSEYVMLRQQGQIPLEAWTPAVATEIEPSEFDSAALDLIGCIVRLVTDDSRVHSGRIVNRRHDSKHDRWEHLVQFKSGAEGRNIPHTEWLCLNEHACMVCGAVKWVRAVDGAFWPALEMHLSGVQLVAQRYRASHSSSSATSSAIENKLYYLFAEERMVSMNSADARLVVPYFAKSKESRLYCGKRLNLAYGLAALEREEIEAARRAFSCATNTTATNEKLLVDGYTTGMLRNFVESCTRLNTPKLPAVTPGRENGLPFVSPVAGATNGSASIGGQDKDNDIADMFGLSRLCYRHVMQYEYCRAVGHQCEPSATFVTHSSADPAAAASAADVNVVGETCEGGGDGDTKSGAEGPTPSQVAPPAVELPSQPMLCLDRALLEVECGLSIPAAAVGSASSAQPCNTSFPSPVLFCFPKPPSSEVPKSNKKDKRKSAASDSGDTTLDLGVKLSLKTFEFKDMVFKKYKADTLRKQEELLAQKEAEEQERLQRAAARKARLAEMSSTAHVNPWFADGEDFTRKSSRLSGVARPAYSDIDGENIVVTDLKTTVKVDAPRQESKADAQLCSLQALVNDAASANDKVEPTSTTKSTRGNAKNKKKRAQEEEEYQEFLHSAEQQPRLLSDVDRDTWVGTVVTYLMSSEKGRVIEYRSGWVVVRTLKSTINCRPYQLEVVEQGSEAIELYEDEEMWALCGEVERKEEKDTKNEDEEQDYTSAVTSAPLQASTAMDIDGFDFSDSVFAVGDESSAVHIDGAGLDDTDVMYNAFVNDEEYEAFLLNQFDPQVDGNKGIDTRRPGIQAARQQQLKPSRTKFLETVPLSEEEKKKRLQALAKKREQTKLLLLRGQSSASSGSATVPNTTTPAMRSISITRKKEISPADEDIVHQEKELSKPANPPVRVGTTFAKRETPLTREAPIQVMKLGSAPPLARAIIPRDGRRPSNADSAPRRLSSEGVPLRREPEPRASLPIESELRIPQEAHGKDERRATVGGRPNERERVHDRPDNRSLRDEKNPSQRSFESADRAYRSREPIDERGRVEKERFDAYRSQNRRPERDSFGRDRYHDREDRGIKHADGDYGDRNRYDRRDLHEERHRDDGFERDRSVTSDHFASALHTQTQSQARDPRIKSRLDRDAARDDSYYGPSSHTFAAGYNTASDVHSAPNTAIPTPAVKGATRDTDYRSMKNSSEAVRTAKANIDYLQASFLAEKDAPVSPANPPAGTVSTVQPAKKVNFEAKPSSISRSFIDVDVLNITGDDDVGYFSPVSVDESDEEKINVTTRPIMRVDEMDRFKAKTKLQSPLQHENKGLQRVAQQDLAVSTKRNEEISQRRSRFAPVDTAGSAQEFAAPAAVPDLLSELAKFAEEINAKKDVKDSEQEPKLSKQERRRLKRDAQALVKEIEAQRVAAGLAELGEIVEDEFLQPSPSKKQRRTVETGASITVTPAAGPKGGRTVLVGDVVAATPNIIQPTGKVAHDAKIVKPADKSVVPAVAVKKVPALLQVLQKQAGVSNKYTIDRSYPQFNHRTNEQLAVRHMDSVMPQSMVNLTAVLNGDSFFPTIGCELKNGRHVVSPRASRFSNDLSLHAPAFETQSSAHPRTREPTVLYPAQDMHMTSDYDNAPQRAPGVSQTVHVDVSRRSRFAADPTLQIERSDYSSNHSSSPRAQVLYPRTPAMDDYNSRHARPMDVPVYHEEYSGEFDRYSNNSNRHGSTGQGRGGWEQRNRDEPSSSSARRNPEYNRRQQDYLPANRGSRRN